MYKGVDLEDTSLVVEGFSQQLQPLSRILQKKEPGGRRVTQLRTHSGQPYVLCPLTPCPSLLPHCPITAGCSHKGAEARPVELTHSQGHVPAENTHSQRSPAGPRPRLLQAVRITWSLGPP